MKDLTAKQRRFVEEYAVDSNATQAAIRAGYSPRTARAIGHENLTKPDVAQAVEESRLELAEKAGLSAERIMEEFKRLGFSDLRDSLSWSGNKMVLRDSSDLTPDAARAIQQVTETVTENEDGGRTVRRTIKLHDKVGPLRDLAKILGMYPKDGTGVNVSVNVDNRPAAKPLNEWTEAELDFYERILDSSAEETIPNN